jgi:LysM repeat protein
MQRSKPIRISAVILLCLGLMVALTACYQPQGTGLEPTSIAFVQATFTLVPSETPFPSATPPPTEDTGSLDFGALVAFTNTPDPVSLAQTQVAQAQPVEVVQADPLIMTATALANLAALQSQPVITDPLILTATAIANLSAQSQQVQAQQDIDPLFLTATALVQGATQTAAYPMTQTMEALLGPSATATLPPFQPTFTPPPVIGGACTHTVVAGDNLFRLSLRFNTTVNAIAAANGIVNPNLIIVGQVLNIPNCGGGGVVATPPPGGGSGSFNCTGQTYVVQQGESLFQIALRFNVPIDVLAQCNGITNTNLIFVNQQLVIPTAV